MTACSSCGVMDDKHMPTCYFMIRVELAAVKAEIEDLRMANIILGFDISKLESETKRLREALQQAADDLHSKFCGTKHHEVCIRAQSALDGGKRDKCMFCAKEAGVCECLKNMRSNRCWCGEGLPCPHGGKEGKA